MSLFSFTAQATNLCTALRYDFCALKACRNWPRCPAPLSLGLEPEEGSRAEEGCRRVGREPPAVAWHRVAFNAIAYPIIQTAAAPYCCINAIAYPSFRPRQPWPASQDASQRPRAGYAIPMNESFAIPWPVGGKRGMSSSLFPS